MQGWGHRAGVACSCRSSPGPQGKARGHSPVPVSWMEAPVQPPPTAPWEAAETQPRAAELLHPCMEDGKVLTLPARSLLSAAGTEGEISCALRSSLRFGGFLRTPPKPPINHQHQTAAVGFTKPLLAASPPHFSSPLHRCDAQRLRCRLRFY